MTGHLNQDAIWHKSTGKKNAFNEPEFTTTEIKVRWEERRRYIRNRKGQTVESQASVTCKEPVQEGDYLEYRGRKWPVITLDGPPDINGKILYWEVYV